MSAESLEKRVQALEDAEEIKKMHQNYIYWLDQKNYEKMIECFAEDAEEQIGEHPVTKGKAAIAKMFREVIAKEASAKGGHILAQPVIQVRGDQAEGYWTMYRFDTFITPAGQLVKWVQGRYDCKYVKEGEKWKFRSLKYTVPWP
jgi:ketosteroid isomerase-like protein